MLDTTPSARAPGLTSAPRSGRALTRRLAVCFGVVLVLAVPAAVQTQPSPSRLATAVTPNAGDPLFVTWTMGWEAHAALHHPSRIFDANIFYPRRDAVAWSDNLLAAMPVFGLIEALTGGRVLMAYNLVTLLGFVAVGLSVYVLARHLWPGRSGPLVAATLFSLSASRSMSVGHTQLVGFLFVPLALAALIQFLRTRRWRAATAFGAASGATWLVTAYYAVLLAVVVGAFLAVWVVQRRLRVGPRFFRGVALAGVVTGALVGPTLAPYVRLQQAGLFRRHGAEQLGVGWADVGRLPPSLLYRSLLGVARMPRYDRGDLYPGGLLVLLVVVAAGAALWDRGRPRHGLRPLRGGEGFAWPLAAGALPCLALMIGPGAGVVSLPFDALRAAVPGVASLRDLDRFWAYPLLCGALTAGWGAGRLVEWCRGRWRAVLVVALVAMSWGELLFRPPMASIDLSARATAANHALAHLPSGPVMELPQPLGSSLPYVDSARQVRSLIDRDPRVDGYSGNVPPLTEQVEYLASRVPVTALVPTMRRFGVRYLVLHGTLHPCAAGYGQAELKRVVASLRGVAGVEDIVTAGPDVIVVLAPSPISRRVPAGGPGPMRPVACS